jgi:hypothetical protein
LVTSLRAYAQQFLPLLSFSVDCCSVVEEFHCKEKSSAMDEFSMHLALISNESCSNKQAVLYYRHCHCKMESFAEEIYCKFVVVCVQE